jgi:hypothetical protein
MQAASSSQSFVGCHFSRHTPPPVRACRRQQQQQQHRVTQLEPVTPARLNLNQPFPAHG